MRKKVIYCLGIYILMIQVIFFNTPVCYASENGSEAAEPVPSAITSVSVSPGSTVVSKSSSYAFVASVTGKNNYNREVLWSVSGQTSQNTFIDGSGILHVGSDETSSSLIVKAVSKQDSNYSATALATVQTSSYSIQVKASPDNGGTVYGSGTVKEGGYAVISAVPNSGFTFEGWLLNNNRVSGNSQYTVENIHSDGVYIADFKPVTCQINVSVNNSNAGTATGSRTVKYGESMMLEAVANDGYQFDGWMENGTTVSTDSRLQLDNITDSRNLTAMFSQNKYSLSLNCWPAGAGSASGQGTYDKGSNITIKAVPIDGYRFASWSENGNVISTDQEYTINDISKDRFLVATFEKWQAKTYSITATVSSSNGTIVPEGRSTVSEGSGLSYVIIPQSGYVIKNVYIDGRSVGAVSSYSFSDIKGNHTISADFAAGSGQDGDSDAAGDKADDSVQSTGTLRYLNISAQEAERLIDKNDDTELMNGALETGDLQVIIHNDFADTAQEIFHSSFNEKTSVTNLKAALDGLLTKEEKIEMLQGNLPVSIDLHIDDNDGKESRQTIKSFEENKLPGMTVGQYFEIRLMKSVQNDTQMISELSEELKVVINVPEDLRADNRKFYILRLHTNEDGSQDFALLLDEDISPDTITFSTDRFSPYAIAYMDWTSDETGASESTEASGTAEGGADDKGMINVIGIMAVAIAVVITCGLLWYIVVKKKQRGRAK